MNKPILIGDEYLSQVRSYSTLGYTVKRICTLLSLSKEQRTALSIRISLPGDAYHEAYQNGRATGEYNIDAELAKKAELGDIDAITLLKERKNDHVEIDLRQQLFGI
ncbi:MAG: hypothetical protein LBK58_12215 [Prevotellaceae bacterium]|jgi:hypothetical protein|nr:hypothetical protein [Prevotellaceae bacterium]